MTIEERLSLVEAQLQKALPLLKRIEESSVVGGYTQDRHERIMSDHAEWLQSHDRAINAHNVWLQAHEEAMQAHDKAQQASDRDMAEYREQRKKDADEARERGKVLDKRIGDLVSAIGEWISRKNGEKH